MDLLLPIAKASVATTQAWAPLVPSHWPAQTDLLTACQTMGPGEACILVILGIIYLMFGYAIFRALVTLNAMAAGAYLGALMGKSSNAMAAGALIGAIIAAAITFPLMKYAVTIMGGIFGAALGASLWRQGGLQADLAWAGALSGLIFFGMLSMILYRGSVILYTSLQGAVMLVFGILGLLYKYQSMAPDVTAVFSKRAFILPTVVLIPALVGLLYQQSMHPAPAPAKKG
ncbi:MAG TPA: hypothetical protein VH475_21705 [Tepidisphaeraceae bacterium]